MGFLSTNLSKRVRIGRDILKSMRGKLTAFLLRAQREKENSVDTLTVPFTKARVKDVRKGDSLPFFFFTK